VLSRGRHTHKLTLMCAAKRQFRANFTPEPLSYILTLFSASKNLARGKYRGKKRGWMD
jgi:hypothetical protein